MNIDNLTVGELKSISKMMNGGSSNDHPYDIGENYFFRSVTHHITGRLVAVTDKELVFEDAAWIADDGRLADTFKTGEFNEVEPYPEGKLIVGRGSLIDCRIWPHPLPRTQK